MIEGRTKNMEAPCPRCERPGFVLLQDEVDFGLGAGAQTALTGGDCESCGPLVFRRCCLTWEFQPHAWPCVEPNVAQG